jgi:hypothetical protein
MFTGSIPIPRREIYRRWRMSASMGIADPNYTSREVRKVSAVDMQSGGHVLRMEIGELEALNFDIGKIGFDTDALAKLLDGAAAGRPR